MRIFGIGTDISPALVSVGYIVGKNIAILVFSGGLISWLIAIPIYSYLYGWEGDTHAAAWNIWNTKIRYLGVGAMVGGGIWSLIELITPLIKSIQSSLNSIPLKKMVDMPPIPKNRNPPQFLRGWQQYLMSRCTNEADSKRLVTKCQQDPSMIHARLINT